MQLPDIKRQPGSGMFAPGQSANPGGRPGGTTRVREILKKKIGDGEELIDLALKIARRSSRNADRLAAIRFLADYAWGKPREYHEISGVDGGPIPIEISTMPINDVKTAVQELLARRGRAIAVDAAGAGEAAGGDGAHA